jgi:hypothetical protein
MTSQDPPPKAPRALNVALGATALVGAWLLFQVQPMVAKRILPWFGGGTAVWTTAMLFFQAGLFLGYAYVHLVARVLCPRRQAALHAVLLAGAVALLGWVSVVPEETWKPLTPEHPVGRILGMLAACVGLPYVMLAATAPLVQTWFARANPGQAPYRLYALSNLGSLAALVSYPALIEPQIGVAAQGLAWSALFVAFAILCGVCGAAAARFGGAGDADRVTGDAANLPTNSRPAWLQVFFWLALPACASALLLAITAHLCQDVASVPLLWIAPMATYLVTFILAFDSPRWRRRATWLPAMIVLSLAAAYAWQVYAPINFAGQAAINLGLLFAAGMVCHGELAAMQPAPARLTAYYLAIAAGGALGGVLVGVVAPVALADQYELPIAVVAAWVLALAVILTDRQSALFDGRAFGRLAVFVLLLVALVVALANHAIGSRADAVAMKRNFYGTLKVREQDPDDARIARYTLTHGRVSHGAQFRAPSLLRMPTQYYTIYTGVGRLLSERTTSPRRVGVVGLGVGTLAAYADAGDAFRFYEINPAVIQLADAYFTYLDDARQRGATIDLAVGDGRVTLESEPTQKFDVLVLDAFNGDAVPAHLLTAEAFGMYLARLAAPDGVLAVHVSNGYLDLPRVVQAAGRHWGLKCWLDESPPDGSPAGSIALWALVARPESRLAQDPLGVPIEQATEGRPAVLWTDDFNNIVDVLRLDAPLWNASSGSN